MDVENKMELEKVEMPAKTELPKVKQPQHVVRSIKKPTRPMLPAEQLEEVVPETHLLGRIVLNIASCSDTSIVDMIAGVSRWKRKMLFIALWNEIEQRYEFFYVHGSSLKVSQRVILDAIKRRVRCNYYLSACARAWFANPADELTDYDMPNKDFPEHDATTRGSLFAKQVAELDIDDTACIVIREETESLAE